MASCSVSSLGLPWWVPPGGSPYPAHTPVKDPLVEGSSVSFEHTIRFLVGH